MILTGMSSNGAVLYTAHTAAVLGFKVVVATDAMAGADPFDSTLAMY